MNLAVLESVPYLFVAMQCHLKVFLSVTLDGPAPSSNWPLPCPLTVKIELDRRAVLFDRHSSAGVGQPAFTLQAMGSCRPLESRNCVNEQIIERSITGGPKINSGDSNGCIYYKPNPIHE